mmetsp:Transcript_40779/g.95219  ORF Transcript_40779/g.95219 Transcript_40779/m.95219 type:complete len:205 (+) Transcript_40779:352-966(+)
MGRCLPDYWRLVRGFREARTAHAHRLRLSIRCVSRLDVLRPAAQSRTALAAGSDADWDSAGAAGRAVHVDALRAAWRWEGEWHCGANRRQQGSAAAAESVSGLGARCHHRLLADVHPEDRHLHVHAVLHELPCAISPFLLWLLPRRRHHPRRTLLRRLGHWSAGDRRPRLQEDVARSPSCIGVLPRARLPAHFRPARIFSGVAV